MTQQPLPTVEDWELLVEQALHGCAPTPPPPAGPAEIIRGGHLDPGSTGHGRA